MGTEIIDPLQRYFAGKDAEGNAVFHIPWDIEIAFDLEKIREQWPNTTQQWESGRSYSILTLRE